MLTGCTSVRLFDIVIYWIPQLIFTCFLFYGCMPPPPVNLSFENAAVLKKGL